MLAFCRSLVVGPRASLSGTPEAVCGPWSTALVAGVDPPPSAAGTTPSPLCPDAESVLVLIGNAVAEDRLAPLRDTSGLRRRRAALLAVGVAALGRGDVGGAKRPRLRAGPRIGGCARGAKPATGAVARACADRLGR